VFVRLPTLVIAGVIPNMKVAVLATGNQTVSVTWAVPSTTKSVVAIVTVKINVVGPIVVRVIPVLLEVAIATPTLSVYRV
jgi:hypothetical protein